MTDEDPEMKLRILTIRYPKSAFLGVFDEPLVDQLGAPGKLMAPVGSSYNIFGQDLVLMEKDAEGRTSARSIMKVSYVPLIGEHGWDRRG